MSDEWTVGETISIIAVIMMVAGICIVLPTGYNLIVGGAFLITVLCLADKDKDD